MRHQKGSYAEALTKQQKWFKDKEKLQKWKMALRQVPDLSGYHFKDGYTTLPMVGVGKSTLARAVYNGLIADNFDSLCFLENVREKSDKHGIEYLQSILISQVLRKEDINLTSKQQGISTIKSWLKRKKVLLILDDVDNLEHLQALAGGCDWFGPGSRIIITTRDKQLLATHQVTRMYEVRELNENDALRLLTLKAFKTEMADPGYELVLNRLVTYAYGLPLALEVIGSNLFGKSIKEWESATRQFKRIPKKEILEILK